MFVLKQKFKNTLVEVFTYQPNPPLNIFLWFHIIVFAALALMCLYFAIAIQEIFKPMVVSAMFLVIFSIMTYILKQTNIKWLWLAPISLWISVIYTTIMFCLF